MGSECYQDYSKKTLKLLKEAIEHLTRIYKTNMKKISFCEQRKLWKFCGPLWPPVTPHFPNFVLWPLKISHGPQGGHMAHVEKPCPIVIHCARLPNSATLFQNFQRVCTGGLPISNLFFVVILLFSKV